jgi:hypothetical protein
VADLSGSDRAQEAAAVEPFDPDGVLALEMALTAALYTDRCRARDVILDYSDESIAAAEEVGVQTYAALCHDLSRDELKELQGTLVLELGAYVGETFIRNHGGQWGWAAMPGGRAFGLRTDSGLNAFPLTKAKKRLLGNLGSLVAFYQLLVRWPEAGK